MTTVVAFDFDGTLTRCDTLLAFIRHAVGTPRFLFGFLLHSPWLVAYKLRLYPNWRAKERIFSWFFCGMEVATFEALCHSFFAEKGETLLRTGARQCVEGYTAKGCKVVVISASVDQWVIPFAASLGIRQVIGTQIAITPNGRLTGRFATPNCYGSEKVSRLLRLYPNRTNYRLIAYGDSRGDRELLAAADEAHYRPFRKK